MLVRQQALAKHTPPSTTYPELLTDDISLGQNLSQCSGTKDITQSALRDSESGVLGILSLEDGGYGVCYPEVDHSIDLGSHTVLSQDLYREGRSTRSIGPSTRLLDVCLLIAVIKLQTNH